MEPNGFQDDRDVDDFTRRRGLWTFVDHYWRRTEPGQIIFDVGLMSFIFGIPFYLLVGILNAMAALLVLNK